VSSTGSGHADANNLRRYKKNEIWISLNSFRLICKRERAQRVHPNILMEERWATPKGYFFFGTRSTCRFLMPHALLIYFSSFLFLQCWHNSSLSDPSRWFPLRPKRDEESGRPRRVCSSRSVMKCTPGPPPTRRLFWGWSGRNWKQEIKRESVIERGRERKRRWEEKLEGRNDGV